MTYTDFYLKSQDEATALEAANVEGYDLVIQDDEGLRWNTSPEMGKAAFAITHGPIVGYTEGEEGEQIPIYADGFYGLLRVRTEVADEIQALLSQRGVEQLQVAKSPTRFS